MDYAESSAAAETELREAILLEFIKPELPATIVLLRHCTPYITKIFDVRAAQKLDKMHRFPRIGSVLGVMRCQGLMISAAARDEYDSYLRGMVKWLPEWFFGCYYSTIPVPDLGSFHIITDEGKWERCIEYVSSPWGRCVEYALLARVDHSDLPGTDDEILKRYSVINGHLFLTYALQTRADFWGSTAENLTDRRSALKPVTRTSAELTVRVQQFVDDQHRLCVDHFNKIRQTTTVDKWLQSHRGISRTQFNDYLAGRIKRKISTAKREAIETAILSSRQ
jgi:hypothetical protein